MWKRILIGISAAVVVAVLLGLTHFPWRMNSQRGIDRARFLDTARQSDPRVVKMYALDPEADAKFNDGNRAGLRGAFAPIAQTFTLSAKVGKGHVLKLYHGIAPRVVAPDGITVVESAYGVQPPNGEVVDLTKEEFDALLDARGDVGVLKPEVWNRPRLRTKHL